MTSMDKFPVNLYVNVGECIEVALHWRDGGTALLRSRDTMLVSDSPTQFEDFACKNISQQQWALQI